MKSLSAAERRRRRSLYVMATLAVLSTLVFGILQKSGQNVTYGFTLDKEWVLIQQWVISSKTASLLFGGISLLASIAAFFQFRAGKTIGLASGIGSAGIMMSFLSWAAAGKFIPFTGLLQGALLLSVPLIFGSMAGVLSERSGVVNIAIEGQLLAGAFVSGVVASLTHSTFLGLVVAPLAGCLISTLLAVFAINFAIDQIILGFVLNVLVYGITDFLYKKLLIPYQSTWNSGPTLSAIKIPFLWKIPIVGPILFDQSIIVSVSYTHLTLPTIYSV